MKTPKDITAEEFYRNKIRELNPNQSVVTLANELITGEQGLRWAHEFADLKVKSALEEKEKEIKLNLNN